MSLTSPQIPSCSCCAVDPWRTGGFGRFVLTRCCVGDVDLGAVLSLCFPSPSAFPTISLCVAKTFALKIHSYTLDVFPVLFRGKKEEEKKAKPGRKERLFPVILYFPVSSSGLCSPGIGPAAPERELGSWNCALCRGFLCLM